MANYNLAIKIKDAPRTNPSFQFSNLPDFGMKMPLKTFQVQGMMYLYAAKKCVLADSTGLGKTAQCIGLIQLLEHQDKEDNRWLIVATPSTILQWGDEFSKFSSLPAPVLGIWGNRERMSNYVSGFNTMIISYQVLLRDWDTIKDLSIKNWIFDDGHFFRHHYTKTAGVVKYLTRDANRVIISTATPMQKNPLDLHSLLEALGLNKVFGTPIGFENHYCVMKKTHRVLRDGRQIWKKEFVSARNLGNLKQKVHPYLIRRDFSDVEEELPALIVKPVWLPMTPQQQHIQSQIHKKLVQAWDAGEEKYIRNKGFHFLRQNCTGTRTLGLAEDHSSKLDAVEQFIDDKLGDEKVLVYSFYKETVRVLAERLRKKGRTDFEIITGDTVSKQERERVKKKFMEDPNTRILIGTDCIKVGLNLQVARYLICVDLILNAQEVVQLIGRLRRIGAKSKTIVVYFLLTKDTIEDRLYRRLKYESALYDVLFDSKSEVFPALSTMELVTLMGLNRG